MPPFPGRLRRLRLSGTVVEAKKDDASPPYPPMPLMSLPRIHCIVSGIETVEEGSSDGSSDDDDDLLGWNDLFYSSLAATGVTMDGASGQETKEGTEVMPPRPRIPLMPNSPWMPLMHNPLILRMINSPMRRLHHCLHHFRDDDGDDDDISIL